jgi:hypothetical protein
VERKLPATKSKLFVMIKMISAMEKIFLLKRAREGSW